MPDTYIRFSDLKDSHPSPIDGANDLLAIAHKDTQSSTGYTSMSVTPNSLGAHAVEDQTFVNLHTTKKTVEGAINEISDGMASWTDVTGTLTAGQTSITLSDNAITTSSTVEIFTSDGTEWNSITVATGSVTVTFDAKSSNLGVKARIT